MIKILNSEKGFTLVELMVALGLFGIIVTISIGSVIGLFDANRKSQSLASVVNNLNFSIENMTRIIRFAGAYHCSLSVPLSSPNDCSSGDVAVAVTNGSGTTIFRFNSGTGKIETSTTGGNSYTPITSDEVTIQSAKFYVFNTTPGSGGDVNQPYILVIIRGFAGGSKPSSQSSFDVQTIISQRELDL